ncbi:MAG: hypothetical protein ACFFA0_08700 [Promethearchaeota archaeon]
MNQFIFFEQEIKKALFLGVFLRIFKGSINAIRKLEKYGGCFGANSDVMIFPR